MADRLDYAKEWMRDGDQLLQRAGQRLARFDADREPIHLEAATQDYSRAAQMYLTGAVEYQRGREAATLATANLDDTVRLVQRLEGRMRSEAEAAWQAAERHLLPSQAGTRSGSVEPARSFAESLRERLSHAAPELFDRASGHEHSREWNPPRSR
jgi:hypothetical protein